MKLSIFTPSHHNKFLPQAYASLKAQSDPDWEWTIVHNNGGEPFECDDTRVKQHLLYKAPDWVGALKAYACEHSTGDALLELDHDDMLGPTAIADVKEAFADDRIGFVYSNSVHMDKEFKKVERFSEAFGWKYRDVEFDGHNLDEHISFEPTPESVSRIWYAPNHVRAFRRSVYEKIGGYNKEMRVLDDQDLMCRMYLAAEFKHIDKPLYCYRIHGENTWLRFNKEIQDNVYRLHDQYAESLATAWADRQGLRKLELGGRIAGQVGFETVDLIDANVNCDLEQRWPFEDSSIGVIRANDIFEHLKDPIHTMSECYRVLAPGGWIFAQVPSTDGRGAFQDPTHKSFWNENSFLYYTHANWAKYINTPVRFQAVRLFTTKHTVGDMTRGIAGGVCWTVAHLISLKDGYRPAGLIQI